MPKALIPVHPGPLTRPSAAAPADKCARIAVCVAGQGFLDALIAQAEFKPAKAAEGTTVRHIDTRDLQWRWRQRIARVRSTTSIQVTKPEQRYLPSVRVTDALPTPIQ